MDPIVANKKRTATLFFLPRDFLLRTLLHFPFRERRRKRLQFVLAQKRRVVEGKEVGEGVEKAKAPLEGEAHMCNLSTAVPAELNSCMASFMGTKSADPGPSKNRATSAPQEVLDRTTRDRMVTEHMHLVKYVAKSLKSSLPAHVDHDELESAGYLGLIEAAENFNPARSVQFRTYAQLRIRGSILDSLRLMDWSSRSLRRKGRAVERAIEVTSQRGGKTATEADVANELGISLVEYQHLLGDLHSLAVGSLNVSQNDETGDETLEYLAGAESEEPLFRCLESELRQHLAEAIEELPERERLVLTLSYFEEMTSREIANLLCIGESRVSQVRTSAVLHLRTSLAAFGTDKEVRGQQARDLIAAA